MEGFPREFLPSKGHQTIKDVQIPIPISNNQSLLEQPYTFEFMYNSVDSPYIDFSNSYLELWLNVTSNGADNMNLDSTKPVANLYSIIGMYLQQDRIFRSTIRNPQLKVVRQESL